MGRVNFIEFIFFLFYKVLGFVGKKIFSVREAFWTIIHPSLIMDHRVDINAF